MSEVTGGNSKFAAVFKWSGLVLLLVGLFLVIRGQPNGGLMAVVAGVVFWLFAKRRSRRAGSQG